MDGSVANAHPHGNAVPMRYIFVAWSADQERGRSASRERPPPRPRLLLHPTPGMKALGDSPLLPFCACALLVRALAAATADASEASDTPGPLDALPRLQARALGRGCGSRVWLAPLQLR